MKSLWQHILNEESESLPRADLAPVSIFRGIRYSDEDREYISSAEKIDGAAKILGTFGIAHSGSGTGAKACIKDLSVIISQFISSENPSKVFQSSRLVSNPQGTNTGVLVECTALWANGILDSKGRPLPNKSKRMCCFWIKNLCIAAVVSGAAAKVNKSALNRNLEVEVAGNQILVYFSKSGRSSTWNE